MQLSLIDLVSLILACFTLSRNGIASHKSFFVARKLPGQMPSMLISYWWFADVIEKWPALQRGISPSKDILPYTPRHLLFISAKAPDSKIFSNALSQYLQEMISITLRIIWRFFPLEQFEVRLRWIRFPLSNCITMMKNTARCYHKSEVRFLDDTEWLGAADACF